MKIIIEPENGPVQVWSTEPAENRATLYENRAKELEKQLAEEKDRAEAWELRCGELEQELRDAKECETHLLKSFENLGEEIRELQDRIGEQNWTIGCYDQENGELREKLAKAKAERERISAASGLEESHLQDRIRNLLSVVSDQSAEINKKHEMIMAMQPIAESDLRAKLAKAEAEAKWLRDQLAEKTAACEKWETIEKERKDLCDKLREELNDMAKQLKCMKEGEYLAWKTYFEPCAEPSDIDADLTTRAREIHQIAVDHGWYDPDEDGRQRSFPEIAMLCVCELAEAVESYRKGEPPVFFKPVGDDSKRQKPEGYAVEMMDCVIRILDWFGYAENKKLFSETPDEVMDTKCEYNKTRPYRHGGKKL